MAFDISISQHKREHKQITGIIIYGSWYTNQFQEMNKPDSVYLEKCESSDFHPFQFHNVTLNDARRQLASCSRVTS
jgi:hypothetical protein